MSVLEGESAAIVGNAVAKGDVLVRGLMSSETGDERYVHSMAQVIADTWYEISAQTPMLEERKNRKERPKHGLFACYREKADKFFSPTVEINAIVVIK